MSAVAMVRVGEVLELKRREVVIDVSVDYEEIGVRSFGKGIFHKEPVQGATLGTKRVFRIEPGDLVISNVFAWEGAIAVASLAEAGTIGSHRFMTFVARDGRIDTSWAAWFFLSEPGSTLVRKASPGSAGRNKTLAVQRFEDLEIPLPPMKEQQRVVDLLKRLRTSADDVRRRIARTVELALAAEVSLAAPPSNDGPADAWEQVALSDVVSPSLAQVAVEQASEYRITGTYSFGKGLIDRGPLYGADTAYKVLTRIHRGNIVVSKLNGWEGAIAVVNPSFDGTYVSGEYPTFVVDETRMVPGFFRGLARSPSFWRELDQSVRGSMVRRRRLSGADFLQARVWLPSLDTQRRVSHAIDDLEHAIERSKASAERAAAIVSAVLNREFRALKS